MVFICHWDKEGLRKDSNARQIYLEYVVNPFFSPTWLSKELFERDKVVLILRLKIFPSSSFPRRQSTNFVACHLWFLRVGLYPLFPYLPVLYFSGSRYSCTPLYFHLWCPFWLECPLFPPSFPSVFILCQQIMAAMPLFQQSFNISPLRVMYFSMLL